MNPFQICEYISNFRATCLVAVTLKANILNKSWKIGKHRDLHWGENYSESEAIAAYTGRVSAYTGRSQVYSIVYGEGRI